MASHSEIERQDLLSKEWLEFASSINRLFSFYGGIIGVILFVLILIFGFDWFGSYIYIPTGLVISLLFGFTLVVGILLSVFKSSRGFGGSLILFSSTFLVGSLWLWSLMLAKVFAGTFWMILGVLLGGFGVIPLALIAVLIHTEWWLALQIALGLAFIFALRSGSVFIFMNASEYKSARLDISVEGAIDRKVNHFLSEYDRRNIPLAEFNKMIDSQPLIKDISLLPIRNDLAKRIFTELTDKAIELEVKLQILGYPEKAKQVNAILDKVSIAEVFLDTFKEIKPEDKADVKYINSTFKNSDELIESENEEYFEIWIKYS